jgi:PiT family inorganic phosphate transporter
MISKLPPLERKRELLAALKAKSTRAHLTKKGRKQLARIYQQELVKRSHLLKIAAAWVITVPVSGCMAAMFYHMIRGMMLP